jgi:hypothetical protein
MQKTSLLLVILAGLLSACIAYDASAPRAYTDNGGDRVRPNGLRATTGDFCPPRLAMKGHC